LRIKSSGDQALELPLVQHRFTKRGSVSDSGAARSTERSGDVFDSRVITERYEVDNLKKLIPSREQIEEVLQETAGNISETARRLSRSRRQIHRYLKMYNIDIAKLR
jgi:ActR/RegA family two-component response regulator